MAATGAVDPEKKVKVLMLLNIHCFLFRFYMVSILNLKNRFFILN